MKRKDKYPDLSIERRIELLKDAIDVSGERLLPIGTKDEKISEQIDMLDNLIVYTRDEVKEKENTLYREAIKLDPKTVNTFIETEVKNYFNCYNYDNNFWIKFSSAPYYQKHEDEKGRKGGVGMDTIFGSKFEDCDRYDTDNLINLLKMNVEQYHKKNIKKTPKVSKYSCLGDFMKIYEKIRIDAIIFYKDETQGFDERIKVFNKFGKKETYIYTPNNPNLKQIFDIMNEQDYFERHQTVECTYIVDCWVEYLEDKRCKISYNENRYHPKIIKTDRNYTPSNKAIERLRRYYYNIIMSENVAKFDFDW
jgi:hypothetical protein